MPPKTPNSGQRFSTTTSSVVKWTGPDLDCISLCNGDMIDDVIEKAAEVLCKVKEDLNLSDLDLKNLFDVCAACPQPAKTLKVILQLLINKVKSIDDFLENINTSSTQEEKILTISACFRSLDQNGDLITTLSQSAYTLAIGSQVCVTLTQLAGIQTNVNSLNDDLDNLTGRVGTLETQIGEIDTLANNLATLDDQLAALELVLGNPTDLATVLAGELQSADPNSGVPSLAQGAGIFLWSTKSGTVADSVNKIWKAIIDVRGAVKTMQDNCCKITCDSIVIDFDVVLDDSRATAKVYFVMKTKLPAGFHAVNSLGTELTITDSAGATTSTYVKIEDYLGFDEDGKPLAFSWDFYGIPDSSLDYTIDMSPTMTNGVLTCMKCITKNLTYKDTCSYCEISVANSGHSATPITSGYIVLVYKNYGDDQIQYMKIGVGETKVIKKSAKILQALKSGNPNVTSTCGVDFIPPYDTLNCYWLPWGFGLTGFDTPLKYGQFDALQVLNVDYPLTLTQDSTEDQVSSAFDALLPVQQGLINNVGVRRLEAAGHKTSYIWTFQTTDTVAATLNGHISRGDTYDGGIRFYPMLVVDPIPASIDFHDDNAPAPCPTDSPSL